MGPVGVQEMIVIFLVALVLFGPKKLPELGRTIGKAITEFRRAQSELKATFEHHMKELERENESIKEVTRSYVNDINSSINSSSQYDSSNQYDSPYYDSSYGSYDYSSTPAESNPSTVGVTATQGAESTASQEAQGNGTVPRTSTSESGHLAEKQPAAQEEAVAAHPNGHPQPESAAS